MLHTGVVVSLMAVAIEVRTRHSNSIRLDAVRTLAAICGGTNYTEAGERMAVSEAQAEAAALFGQTGEEEAIALGADDAVPTWARGVNEAAAVRWVRTIMWPLFDNEQRRLPVLVHSYDKPATFLEAWNAIVSEPFMVWNDGTR